MSALLGRLKEKELHGSAQCELGSAGIWRKLQRRQSRLSSVGGFPESSLIKILRIESAHVLLNPCRRNLHDNFNPSAGVHDLRLLDVAYDRSVPV